MSRLFAKRLITAGTRQFRHGSLTPTVLSSRSAGSELKYPGTPTAKETHNLQFFNDELTEPIPIYTTMDEKDNFAPRDDPNVPEETLLKWYRDMTMIRQIDRKLEATQRIGQNSFYMTCRGEESITVAAASALNDEDVCYTQYREQGLFISRGVPLAEMVAQVFANAGSHADGKQMPVHYGSAKYNLPTVSSPLGTQLPQAAGHAYAIKRSSNPDRCVTVWFGDGSASEGDSFAALNFASVLDCPVIFCCRNNGFAISTPVEEQYRGDGVAIRGIALGMNVIRVNGNDIFAVYNAVKSARQIAVQESRPVFIEFMTYRAGNHSTSDDSSAYRQKSEIDFFMDNYDPITKFATYLRARNLWDSDKDKEWLISLNKEITDIVESATKDLKPCPTTLFDDVYDELTPLLKEQKAEMLDHLSKYGQHYNLGKYEKIKELE